MPHNQDFIKQYLEEKHPELGDDSVADIQEYIQSHINESYEGMLNERVKELNCLHKVSRITRDREKDFEQICRELIACIPDAMRFPDICSAKIDVKDMTIKSANYQESKYSIQAEIRTAFFKLGRLVIAYSQKPQEADKQIFLSEEQSLADTLAELIGASYESRMNEQALIESESKYRRFYKNAGVGIVSTEETGDILDANLAFVRLFGFSDKQDFLDNHSKLQDVLADTVSFTEMLQLMSRFKNFSGTILQGKKDAELKLEVIGVQLQNDNRRYYELVFKDISEQEKAHKELRAGEEKFRAIFNNINDAVGLHKVKDNTIGPFVEVNKRACELFGYTADEFKKLSYTDIFFEEELQNFGALHEELAKNGIVRFETVNKLKGGKTIPTEVKAVAFDMEGEQYLLAVTADISARREAQNRIKESERRYKQLSELTFEGIILHKNGLVIDANKRAFDMFGYSEDEIIGKNILKLVFDEESLNTVREQISKKHAKPYEVTVIHKSGARIPVELEGRNLDDKPDCLRVAAIRDISERKKAENEIREAQKNLESLNQKLKAEKELAQKYFDVAGVLMLVIDRKGFIRQANAKAAEILQYSPEELLGKHWFSNFIPEFERQRVYAEFLRNIKEQNDQPEYFENIVINRQGELRNFQWHNVFLKNQDEKIIGVLSSGLDVTESISAQKMLADSERKFRSIFDYSGVGIALGDPFGKIMQANSVFVEMLGYSKDELYQMFFSDFTHPDDVERERKMVSQMLNGDIDHYSLEKRYVKNDGDIIWVSLNISLLRDKDGRAEWFIGMVADITERKNREILLKKNEEQLSELNATKDKFLSIIAHDLKNPLGQLVGFSSLIMRSIDRGEYDALYRFGGVMHDSATEADKLLNNLLEWSRAQTGRIGFNPEVVDLSSAANEVTESLKSMAINKKITIHNLIMENSFCEADVNMLRTIIRNLLSNAVKFTPRGGDIQLFVSDTPDTILLHVADNGVGMSAETLETLFQIHESNSTKGTEKEKGTGLGLLICKEFAETHGGTIYAKSTENVGSTFTLKLPKHQNRNSEN